MSHAFTYTFKHNGLYLVVSSPTVEETVIVNAWRDDETELSDDEIARLNADRALVADVAGHCCFLREPPRPLSVRGVIMPYKSQHEFTFNYDGFDLTVEAEVTQEYPRDDGPTPDEHVWVTRGWVTFHESGDDVELLADTLQVLNDDKSFLDDVRGRWLDSLEDCSE